MSVRERRNRKDSKGKTPAQIQASYARHAHTYREATEGLHESDLPLSSAGYLQGIRRILEGPAFDKYQWEQDDLRLDLQSQP